MEADARTEPKSEAQVADLPTEKTLEKEENAASASVEAVEKEVQSAPDSVKETEMQPENAATTSAKPQIDPFEVHQVEELFDFTMKLSAIAKFDLKTGGKFIRVYPDVDVVAIAEYLKSNQFGYYRKCIQDYPIRAMIKGLPYSSPTEQIKDNLQELGYSVIAVERMTGKNNMNCLTNIFINVKSHAYAGWEEPWFHLGNCHWPRLFDINPAHLGVFFCYLPAVCSVGRRLLWRRSLVVILQTTFDVFTFVGCKPEFRAW